MDSPKTDDKGQNQPTSGFADPFSQEHDTNRMSSHESEEEGSNGFVTLEHPEQDEQQQHGFGFSSFGGNVHGGFGFGSQQPAEDTPSEETSPLSPDMYQFERQEQKSDDFEFGGSSRHQSDKLSGDINEHLSPSDSGRDIVGDLIGDAGSGYSSPNIGESNLRGHSPDERTYDRQGPLTFGQKDIGGFGSKDMDFSSNIRDEDRPPTPPKHYPTEEPSLLDFGIVPQKDGEKPKPILEATGREPWFQLNTIDPRLLDLIYWRDAKKSGIALGATLFVLLCFHYFSFISVTAYVGLAILAATVSFRLYKFVMAQIQKTDSANPFKPYLDKELTVPQDRVHQQVDVLIEHGQVLAGHLRRLFLVQDIIDTVKFGLVLWTLTYVGSWMSGTVLAIILVIGAFTVPKFYEVYKEPIDKNVAIVQERVKKGTDMAQEKMPFLKRKQT